MYEVPSVNRENWQLFTSFYRPHPWHGLSPGGSCPECVLCYIEIVPSDSMKFEVDKNTRLSHHRPAAALFKCLSGELRVYSTDL